MSMTDEQIVKALEICNSLSQRCGDGCPYYTVIYKNGKRCSEMMIEDTLDLIKRQQAEIENLREDTKKVRAETAWDIATEYEAYKEAVEVALVETRAEQISENERNTSKTV